VKSQTGQQWGKTATMGEGMFRFGKMKGLTKQVNQLTGHKQRRNIRVVRKGKAGMAKQSQNQK